MYISIPDYRFGKKYDSKCKAIIMTLRNLEILENEKYKYHETSLHLIWLYNKSKFTLINWRQNDQQFKHQIVDTYPSIERNIS